MFKLASFCGTISLNRLIVDRGFDLSHIFEKYSIKEKSTLPAAAHSLLNALCCRHNNIFSRAPRGFILPKYGFRGVRVVGSLPAELKIASQDAP